MVSGEHVPVTHTATCSGQSRSRHVDRHTVRRTDRDLPPHCERSGDEAATPAGFVGRISQHSSSAGVAKPDVGGWRRRRAEQCPGARRDSRTRQDRSGEEGAAFGGRDCFAGSRRPDAGARRPRLAGPPAAWPGRTGSRPRPRRRPSPSSNATASRPSISMRGMVVPISFSIASTRWPSSGVARVNEWPVLPARPVRPMR